MNHPLHLVPGSKYRVIKAFTDYNQQLHPAGEEWTFVTTHFIPYEDGLTLHVHLPHVAVETIYRLQWQQEEQAHIMEYFNEYVLVC